MKSLLPVTLVLKNGRQNLSNRKGKTGAGRRLSGWRHLRLSLTVWVQSMGTTWWKERIHSPSCPLTSMYVPWYVLTCTRSHTHTHIYAHRLSLKQCWILDYSIGEATVDIKKEEQREGDGCWVHSFSFLCFLYAVLQLRGLIRAQKYLIYYSKTKATNKKESLPLFTEANNGGIKRLHKATYMQYSLYALK